MVQGSSEGDVAAISHRSDHQTPLSSHIFVPIDKPDTVGTVWMGSFLSKQACMSCWRASQERATLFGSIRSLAIEALQAMAIMRCLPAARFSNRTSACSTGACLVMLQDQHATHLSARLGSLK